MKAFVAMILAVCIASASQAADAHNAAKKLGRGVNFGNALEASSEGEWGITLQPEYFSAIKEAGFDSVRIPIKWSSHASDKPPFTIDPKFFDRIDWAVSQALKNGLNVVVNVHHFDGMDSDPDKYEPELIGLWKQIAHRYKDRPDAVFFELDNEPHDKLTDDRWNKAIPKVLEAIRETNPTRAVIVGPGQWNNWRNIAKLELPKDDRNLIATFHYYEPFEFTHQGAEWAKGSDKWLGRTWTGSDKEMKDLTTAFDTVAKWAKEQDRPVYLGEFGCYSKADMDSRVRLDAGRRDRSDEARLRLVLLGIRAGFGLYDRDSKTWRKPLLDAVLGK